MWLSNLRIVLPDEVLNRGSIQIEDGIITRIVDEVVTENATDLGGMTLMPGIIDLHGDMLERDVEPRPNTRFPTELGLLELDKRLAGAGITTAFAAISFAWKSDDLRSQENATEMINTLNAIRDQLQVDMRVHARFEITNPLTAQILSDLLHEQKVHMVSIMDHTPGQGQYRNVEQYIDFMHRWMGMDMDSLGEFKDRILETVKTRIVHKARQPRDWSIVASIAEVARQYTIPMASHDDDTITKVRQQAGMGFTISEFPVTEAAAIEAQRKGMYVVMGAPNAYRGRSTSNNLSALDAIKQGFVDILATDYYPASMFHTVFKLAADDIMPLHEAVRLVTANPAQAVGFTDRGRVETGRAADLVIIQDGAYPRVHCTLRRGVPIFGNYC